MLDPQSYVIMYGLTLLPAQYFVFYILQHSQEHNKKMQISHC